MKKWKGMVCGYTYDDAREKIPSKSFPNPNPADIAQSCGGRGVRFEKAEHLDNAIRAALDSPLAFPVEVMVDPDKVIAAVFR